MNKLVLFFCDIQGTLIGNKINEENDYVLFNQELNKIGDKIVFSVVSTESNETVARYLNILSNYFTDNIIFGRQYYEDGYIENNNVFDVCAGKCSQIMDYINDLSKTYEIDKVYYAEDNKFICEMVGECINLIYPNIEYQGIIPSKLNGLKELNILINDNINRKTR